MTVCESCWYEAQRRHYIEQTKSIMDHYYEVIREREKANAPCTQRDSEAAEAKGE